MLNIRDIDAHVFGRFLEHRVQDEAEFLHERNLSGDQNAHNNSTYIFVNPERSSRPYPENLYSDKAGPNPLIIIYLY